MRFGEAVIELLHDHYGVDVVFGVPGVHNIELYRGLARSGVRAVSPRHEQGAGFMADGWGRVSGRPGVCAVISGPGLTNILTPVGQAFHDSVAMLVLSSTTATPDLGRGHGPLHDLADQAAVARTMTASSETIIDAEAATALIAEAWHVFTAGRPRPVHLTFPTDVLEQETDSLVPVTDRRHRPEPTAIDIETVAARLAAATNPMIVAGGGTIGAGVELRALAEALDAPVVLSGNAKGVLASSHPLCVGNTLSFAATQQALADADAVLVVGCELSDADIWNGGHPIRLGGTVVRIDIDAAQLNRRLVPDLGLVADAALAMGALATVLVRPPAIGAARAAALVVAAQAAHDPAFVPWLDTLAAVLPPDAIVALDSTQLAYAAHTFLPCEQPRSWLAPFGYGTLGCAVPMAIGAKIAAPGRPVFALVGDGGWLFTVAEMATAVDEQLDIVVVLWDNRGYGQIKVSFDDVGACRIGCDVSSADPEMIARGFGWTAASVDRPANLGAAVREAFASGGQRFIRVKVPS